MIDWVRRYGAAALAVTLILLAVGCGSEKKTKKKTTKPAESSETAPADSPDDAASETEKPATSKPTAGGSFEFSGAVPDVDEPFPPQDDGRIVIRPPSGWHRQPRSSKYLAMFTLAKDQQYPRILVLADDAAGTPDFSEENIEERRAEKAESSKKTVKTATLGGRPALYWKAEAETNAGVELDHEVFETVLDGRRYTVELRADRGMGETQRAALVAVARGVEFPKAAPAP
ncbi:MAG TPA: hypothetical protein VGE52_18880 [Pirellulales bacterium]